MTTAVPAAEFWPPTVAAVFRAAVVLDATDWAAASAAASTGFSMQSTAPSSTAASCASWVAEPVIALLWLAPKRGDEAWSEEDLEFLAACAHKLARAPYPRAELEQAWQILLTNQFHDILAGTSLPDLQMNADRAIRVERRERLGLGLRQRPQFTPVHPIVGGEEQLAVDIGEAARSRRRGSPDPS
mgnify:CR=1 FL=1